MVLAEVTNGQTLRYWHGLGLVAQSDGTTTEYFAYDGLGSVRQVTDSAGSPLMAQTFDPYGNPYVSAGPQESNFGFTGQYQDDNGLLFLRARYYSASSGRFFQMDPSRQERNPYQYSYSNPVNYTDPSGLCGADVNVFGQVDETKTDQCLALVDALESVYGVVIYWPGRSGLPSSIPSDVTCLCNAPNETCTNDVPEFPENWEAEAPYNAQFRAWRLKEMLTLSMAIIIYRDEMGHNATRAAFEGVLFVRADRSPTGGDTIFTHTVASYWNTGYGGFGVPTIFLFNAGGSQGYPEQTWTWIHELAHRLAGFATEQGLQNVEIDFRDEIWGGGDENPGTGPTWYARDSESGVAEDVAETITVYVWDRHSSQFTRGSSSPVPLLRPSPPHRSLDTARSDFVEELFDLLRDAYP